MKPFVMKLLRSAGKILALFVTGALAAFWMLVPFRRKSDANGTERGSRDRLREKDTQEFDEKAAIRKKETEDYIRSASAAAVAGRYEGVCDTISEGQNRFRGAAEKIMEQHGGDRADE